MPQGVEARFFPVCDSTNRQANALAVMKPDSPVWLIAGEQTAGRGRQGRNWVSASGNLYCSLLFAPNLKPAELAPLPFIFALAVRDSFIAMGADETDVHCKWPNDVLISGKKAAGILIETSAASGAQIGHIIIGIGMNLLHSPKDAQFPAISLMDHIGRAPDPREAIAVLANKVKKRLDNWDLTNFSSIQQEWQSCAWGLGEHRQINMPEESFSATLVKLKDDGGLLVQLASGEERAIYAADIFPSLA